MAAPRRVIKADFKKEKLFWTCKCGKNQRCTFEWLSSHIDMDRGRWSLCKCGKKTCFNFLRSIYSMKMQERILEQQAQQAALLAKVLSMHSLGDDALVQ